MFITRSHGTHLGRDRREPTKNAFIELPGDLELAVCSTAGQVEPGSIRPTANVFKEACLGPRFGHDNIPVIQASRTDGFPPIAGFRARRGNDEFEHPAADARMAEAHQLFPG